MSKEQAVYVNVELLRENVNRVLDDFVATLQGPKDGVEDEHTFGLEHERCALYEAVEQAKQLGDAKVLDLLWYTLIPVPLLRAGEHEPDWCLTISLDAGVR
jgi:hypothetical protein